MTKVVGIMGIILIFVLSLYSSGFSQQEQITITTYYPSPVGSYRELRTNQLSVGSTYNNPTTAIPADGMIVQGDVGIGTTSLGAQLHIGKQEAAAGTAGAATRMAIQPYGHTGGPWYFKARDDALKAYLDILYGAASTGVTQDSSGNVGIGTTDPSQRLTVSGNIRAESGLKSIGLGTSGGAVDLWLAGAPLYINNNTSNLDTYINPQQGNVGIGTTSLSYKLDVNGQMRATRYNDNVAGWYVDSDVTSVMNIINVNRINGGELYDSGSRVCTQAHPEFCPACACVCP